MHCDADGRLLVVAGGNRIFYYDEESGDFRLMGSLILGASSIAFIEEGGQRANYGSAQTRASFALTLYPR